MKNLLRSVALLFAVFLYGCAHPYVITPELRSIDRKDVSKIEKNVGYYISAENLALEVTTPGGGGDKVTYKPYKDSEAGLQKVLSNLFSQVHALKSPDDKQFIAANKISFVFIPKIETASSSSSMLTWPPTEFILTLECEARDPAGKTVWQKKIVGKGNAEFSEFKHDFSLAGKKAGSSAFLELQREINSNPLFRANR